MSHDFVCFCLQEFYSAAVSSTDESRPREYFFLFVAMVKNDDNVLRCVQCARMWNRTSQKLKSLLNSDANGMFLSQMKMKVPSWICKCGVSAASRSMWKSVKRYHPLSTSVTMETTANVMHWCTVHTYCDRPNGMRAHHTRLSHANIVHLSTNTRDTFSSLAWPYALSRPASFYEWKTSSQ